MNNQVTILDVHGNPMQKASSNAAYSGGDKFSQELNGWHPPFTSVDSAYLPERNTIVSRVKDLVRNNGWASGAMQRFVDQAIGSSFSLNYMPDYKILGLDHEEVREFARNVEAEWRAYANDPRFFVDAAEKTNFSGLMGIAFRHRMQDGEALALIQWIKRPNSRFCTSMQIISPDRLCNPSKKFDSNKLRAGVELGEFGKVKAFHIKTSHPGEDFRYNAKSYEWKRIPKQTPHGRLRVIHYFESDEGEQTRGRSILSPIIEKLKMEDMYSRTEMQAALLNAILAAYIESPFDHDMLDDAFDNGGIGKYQEMRSEFHEDRNLKLNGVTIPSFFPGENLRFESASRPNTAFPEFERAVLRNVAAGIGQSYEQLAQDWSQTNYSSARAALLESWKFLLSRRNKFADGFATQFFATWLEEAIDNGTVKLPKGSPKFWDAFGAWTKCRWIGPGRGWVDPVKEAKASAMRLEGGLSTLQDEAAEQGRDWEEMLEQRVSEQKRYEDLGLTYNGCKNIGVDSSDDNDRADQKDRPKQ
ncbi:MAG: phage portal protein [Desulfobacterales bacterium]|nr:phage portal protein [Desulfobacterales bacterium]